MRLATRNRSRWTTMLLLAPLALATACESASGAPAAGGHPAAMVGAGASGTPTPPVASITMAPTDGAGAVDPSLPVRVSVERGKLTAVTLTSGGGAPLGGALSPDGSTWTDDAVLALHTTYTLAAQALGSDGRPVSRRTTFTTLTPARTVGVSSITPSDGSTVGVGQPVSLLFDTPVSTPAEQAAVEKNLQVTTAPAVAGTWHWFGDQRVDYRPQNFWAPGTRVSVHADLANVKLADGVWGTADTDAAFTIGRSLVATADVATHRLVVVENGRTIDDFPMTSGMPGLDTWNGTMVVMEKDPSVDMNSETVGLGAAYDIRGVRWAVRLTSSGTFVHAAPWSVGSQGYANVSHGCIGMSTGNAATFFGQVIPGDVVTVVNSRQTVAADNGFGDWNLPWSQWTAGSAPSSG